ncbi:MAG: hypothetical protein BMS9Abin37_0513 [Acidobacteriota bacterium]|nr:MAG: hypothetical protein BMS9Abin37_0513 [Acidobacteriota bacterium]
MEGAYSIFTSPLSMPKGTALYTFTSRPRGHLSIDNRLTRRGRFTQAGEEVLISSGERRGKVVGKRYSAQAMWPPPQRCSTIETAGSST